MSNPKYGFDNSNCVRSICSKITGKCYIFPFQFLQEKAIKQLELLQKEIQDSTEELDKISPSYEHQVAKEEKITKE